MKKKEARCVLTLPLRVEPWQADLIDKRLNICRNVYNALVGQELKAYRRMCSDLAYQHADQVCAQLRAAKQHRNNNDYRESMSMIRDLQNEYGFTEYSFIEKATEMSQHFRENIGTNMASCSIAKPAWAAFKELLKDTTGKTRVHFKPYGKFYSITTNGRSGLGVTNSDKKMTLKLDVDDVVFLRFGTNKGRTIYIPVCPPQNDYERRMLGRDIAQVRLLKKNAGRRRLYYVQLVMKGYPELKMKNGRILHPGGEGTVGIYIDTQTITLYDGERYEHIALTDWSKYNGSMEQQAGILAAKKEDLQRKMDNSRKLSNPENYLPDGRIKRGPLKWHYTNNYKRLRSRYANLCRIEAENRLQFQELLSAEIVSMGDVFLVNDKNFAWEARRFVKAKGKEIGNNSPSSLIDLIDRKSLARGGMGVIKLEFKEDDRLSEDYENACMAYAAVMYDGMQMPQQEAA